MSEQDIKPPNLMVIGAAKCGTTSLQEYLNSHPQVFMTKPKATGFFNHDTKFIKGIDWYLKTFFQDGQDFEIRGEATPSYLSLGFKTAPRIKESLPCSDLKFITIFRNPIDRAYSHYWYNRNHKTIENLTFDDALKKEAERYERSNQLSKRGSNELAYTRNGFYANQLEIFFQYFNSDKFLFILFEDILEDNYRLTSNKICDFLNIKRATKEFIKLNNAKGNRYTHYIKTLKRVAIIRLIAEKLVVNNVRNKLKNQVYAINNDPFKYPPMKKETRKRLIDIYYLDIQKLEKIINRNLSGWLKYDE